MPRYIVVSAEISNPGHPIRLVVLDGARGVALILMAVYHGAWDLTYFRFADLPLFSDPGWIFFPRFIAGSFLFIVGAGLALWWRNGGNWRRYARRLAILVACAVAITAGTRMVFPQQYVFFGILHCIAASSLLALPFLRLPKMVAFGAAAFFMAGPIVFAAAPFNQPGLLWLGLMTFRPSTVDFVPIFPWLGWVLLGLGLARWVLEENRLPPAWTDWQPAAAGPMALFWLGRHSLAFYLIHQPVLFGATYLAALVLR